MSSMRYSGKSLKKLAKVKGAKITRTQTAARAVANIKKKYAEEGGIKDTVTYYHRGRGNWAKYSPARDAAMRPRKGVQTSKAAKKAFGTRRTKTVRNARGKVIGKVWGSNSHKADTKRLSKTMKTRTGRKFRGSV